MLFQKEDEQFFKEQATFLAIRNGMALYDKNLEVYAIRPDGSAVLISRSSDKDKVWDTALRSLKKMYNKRLFNH